MSVTIAGVEDGSIAQKNMISPGHMLLRIGNHVINDVLDYRFYMTDPMLVLELSDNDGQIYTKTIHKDTYADLGLEFDTYLMDEQRVCRNNCVFCFVNQMPPGLRDSLYVKDDDSRMSFLFGNYVTLTNLSDADIDRIIAMRISPINISVHTTNPQLRVLMMKNRDAGKVLPNIRKLAKSGIRINTQIVLCPSINDRHELHRSLVDIAAMCGHNLQSIAVVPVGLTRFRAKLPKLRSFTKEEANDVLAMINEFGDKMKDWYRRRICYASDEFYLLAERDIPSAEYYEDFDQLENGVGILALLTDEFATALSETSHTETSRHVTIATGRAAFPFIEKMAKDACEKINGLTVDVLPIDNNFFGHSVVVAGLITGSDLMTQLYGKNLGDELLLPATMLRIERDMFLDSIHISELESKLNCKVRLVENNGADLLNAMIKR